MQLVNSAGLKGDGCKECGDHTGGIDPELLRSLFSIENEEEEDCSDSSDEDDGSDDSNDDDDDELDFDE